MPGATTEAKAPATKPYRVCIVGAVYSSPTVVTAFDGSESVAIVTRLATFGETVELTAREAFRLGKDHKEKFGHPAVKPADEPLGYEEMNDEQLDAAVKAAGVGVTSSGADQDKPLRIDKINALRTYDQGRGVAAT